MRKKLKILMSVFIAALMCLTATATAFAADDGDTVSQIRESMYEKFYCDLEGVEPGDIEITIVGTTSDGTVLFNYSVPDLMGLTVVTEETVGDFTYTYPAIGADVKIFVNGEAYSLMDAYQNGVVGDDFMTEVATMIDGLECANDADGDNLIVVDKSTSDGDDTVSQIQESMYEKFYCDIKGVEPGDIEITVVSTTSDGTVLFNYSVPDLAGLTVVTEETVGDFTYTYPAAGADVKIFVNGEAYSLMDAYETGVVGDDFMTEAAAMIDGLECVSDNADGDNLIVVSKLSGDADGDGAVSISDVTLIQKYVSRMVSDNEINYAAANISGSGKLSIKDATMVQKIVAGLM